MSGPFDLVVRGATCVVDGYEVELDVGVRDGRIAELGRLAGAAAGQALDATGLHVLPGVIDTQVHLREPGLEHKEDLATGTAAAVAGGVTAVFEMPNTRPATTTAEALQDKLRRAAGRAWCDHAFYVGASGENTPHLAELERLPGCCGVKLFMGSSTGELLVADDEGVRAVLRSGRRRLAVHAEDELRLRERKAAFAQRGRPESHPTWRDAEAAATAVRRLLALARETGRRVHVLHVSSADELPLLAAHRDLATFEVTPQHLTLAAPECYERLGTRAQMNPPIRDAHHREALRRAAATGLLDMVGSDHAPHTLEEKAGEYPDSPSGMTGVQTLVPVLLDHVHAGWLSLRRLVELTSAGPARAFGIAGKGRLAPGFDADLTLVDLKRRETVRREWIRSRCGWSPFEGVALTGWPVATVLRGAVVMRDGELLGTPAGRPLGFVEA